MKLTTKTLYLCAIGLLGASAVVSCSHNTKLPGAWVGAPERINVPEATVATSEVTLDFAPQSPKDTPSAVNLSAVIEVYQAVDAENTIFSTPWEVAVAATASADGTYIYNDGNSDEILIDIDWSTFTITIDPDGITYSENIIDGVESSYLDSLTTETVAHWCKLIAPAVRDQFNTYRQIEDIKIHHDNLMSAEIDHSDYTFRRMGSEIR